MCVNTLIKTIEDKRIKCMGYVAKKTLSPSHWFQFADDTAIVTALKEDNRCLLNLFTKWSSWADLEIRVDKCHSFGVKKYMLSAIQYQPNLIINGEKFHLSKTGKVLNILESNLVFQWPQM